MRLYVCARVPPVGNALIFYVLDSDCRKRRWTEKRVSDTGTENLKRYEGDWYVGVRRTT